MRFRKEYMSASVPDGDASPFQTALLEVPDATANGLAGRDDLDRLLSLADATMASVILASAMDPEGRLSATVMSAPRICGLRDALATHPLLADLGDGADPSDSLLALPMGHVADASVAGEFLREISGRTIRYDRIALCRTDGDGLLQEVIRERELPDR